MSTPFLLAFSHRFLARLIADAHVEILPRDRERVAHQLADALGHGLPGQQLVATIERVLLASPEVVELYADVEVLKDTVDALGELPDAIGS